MSFEDRINSLERQLEEKQRIIEILLSWPNSNINKASHCNAASPMRKREDCNKKSKEPTIKELKNVNKENLKEPSKLPESKKTKSTSKAPRETQRKDVAIIGDSILNGLSEQGLRKRRNVKVRAHSGATSLHIKDHVGPILRRKPDCVLIHFGTNDLTKKDPIDTTEIIEEIIVLTILLMRSLH